MESLLIESCSSHTCPADIVFNATRRFQTAVTIITRLIKLVDLLWLGLLILTRNAASSVKNFTIFRSRERRRRCRLCLARWLHTMGKYSFLICLFMPLSRGLVVIKRYPGYVCARFCHDFLLQVEIIILVVVRCHDRLQLNFLWWSLYALFFDRKGIFGLSLAVFEWTFWVTCTLALGIETRIITRNCVPVIKPNL